MINLIAEMTFSLTSKHIMSILTGYMRLILTGYNNYYYFLFANHIRNFFHSEVLKIHCNTYIFKIFIISLNVQVKTKC